jgi:hypothetical protein
MAVRKKEKAWPNPKPVNKKKSSKSGRRINKSPSFCSFESEVNHLVLEN